MNTPTRVSAFGAGLVVAFGAAFGIGHAADLGVPVADRAADGTSAGAAPSTAGGGGHGHSASGEETPGSPEHAAPSAGSAADATPGGLQVAQDGYRLVLDHPVTDAVDDGALTFRILGPDDSRLRSYTTTHDKDLHLILARRDLSGYAHLHPRLADDGTWSVATSLAAGSWRVLADFDPAGDHGPITLGADLLVPGPLAPTPLPAPSTTAVVDGYTVTLAGALDPGRDSRLTLSVSRDGTPVTDLQPYLAAYGHLVALRQGDLAYLHVHPDGAPGDGRTKAGPEIAFHTTAPSAGTYRLYLDFKHGGVVRTAEFTMTAGKEAPGHGH